MKHASSFTLLALSVLGLATAGAAQGFVTTPKGGLRVEGPHATNYPPGKWRESRNQLMDGEHRGQKLKIARISFRLDGKTIHHAGTAMGRTWSRVTLNMSESSYDTMGRVFSKNVTGTPTQVFDSKWSWAGQTGKTVLTPAAWGGTAGSLSFPFKIPWVYSGKQDIMMDYEFAGGTLANNGNWGEWGSGFMLDTYEVNTRSFNVPLDWLPPRLTRVCEDSSLGLNRPFRTGSMWAIVYGPLSNTSPNSVVFQHRSLTAPNAPVIHAFGLGPGHGRGVDIGTCKDLYVDFSKPVGWMLLRTSSTGRAEPRGQIPWSKGLSNLDVTFQGAWTDSRTNELKLTTAIHFTLPDALPPTKRPRYKALFATDRTSTASRWDPSGLATFFPYTRYDLR